MADVQLESDVHSPGKLLLDSLHQELELFYVHLDAGSQQVLAGRLLQVIDTDEAGVHQASADMKP